MNYNRAAMKQEVKQAMRQTRPHPMLVTLLFSVIVGVGAWLISWLMNTLFLGNNSSMEDLFIGIMTYGEDYLEYMLDYAPQIFVQMMVRAGTVSLVVSILTSAWNGLMSVGYSGYCLDMSRYLNPPLERIFGGFSRAGSVILSYILVAVFTFLWSMLFAFGMILMFVIAVLLVEASRALAALGFLLIFAAVILYAVALVWVSYRYVMVPFAIVDSQNPLSAMDAIRASKNIMKGRKGSYFVLQISFIGWYLLEYLIVMIGVIIVTVAAVGSAGNMYYDSYSSITGVGAIAAVMIPVLLLCGAAIFAINLWLIPYRTGCDARFYVYATGGQPIQPGPYGGRPGPYGGQPGPYGGQPGPYGGQPGPYGGQPGPYGGQSGPYGGQSGPYRSQPGPYSGQPGPYGSQPGPYGSQPGHSGQSGPYGGQPGPYNNGPYGYNPPSQNSFGGYTQGAQPPQYGAGTYPQWGAPQAPAAPDVPAEPVDALYETPYAEPETPDDDTPQRPNDPQ